MICGAAGLIGQTSRDAYRQAYDAWQQAQANLERDAGTGGAALVPQVDRAAAAAASFEATRAAYLKSVGPRCGADGGSSCRPPPRAPRRIWRRRLWSNLVTGELQTDHPDHRQVRQR